MTSSTAILERFRTRYGKDIDLTLRPAYRDLLAKLGDPHRHLPPVFHVAGTNGKGSTCAFLRAMLEAEGYKVHVYTSPHLVRFHERIRVAGRLIGEEELTAILTECERLATPGGVSYFEAATAAAFAVFARTPADFTILETGLGGRLDSTNVVDKPLATLITRISYDHREYLGETIEQIAGEKAGIMKSGVPCFAAAQPERAALETLRSSARKVNAPLSVGSVDWQVREQASGFRFSDAERAFDLPHPALLGAHQYQNAGLAIAALAVLPQPLPCAAIAKGLRTVEWPARLQRLATGRLAALIPSGWELWLDGGHNDSAGEVLAAQIARWRMENGDNPKPLIIVIGMLTTKKPQEFLQPFTQYISRLITVPISGEPLAFTAAALSDEVRGLSLGAVETADDVESALRSLGTAHRPSRILICGSLYLAGSVLALNE